MIVLAGVLWLLCVLLWYNMRAVTQSSTKGITEFHKVFILCAFLYLCVLLLGLKSII